MSEAKEKIKVKIRKEGNYFYIMYGAGGQWEKIKRDSLPWSVAALLNTCTSSEYDVIIEGESVENE